MRASLAPFFLLSIAASGWTIWEQRVHSGATGLEWAQTWPERLIIAGHGIWFYLGKLVWPHPLIFIYPRWSIDSSRPVAYLPLLAAMIALSILWFKRKTWLRPVFFAAAYFVISLFPILGLFSVYFFRYSFVSDHFQYLASIGPLFWPAAGITSGLAALEWQPAVKAAAGACPVAFWVPSDLATNCDYSDVVTLYQDTLEKNPACWMAHYNLAITLREDEKIDEAIRHYREAVALKPDYGEAHYNLARLLVQKGELEDAISITRKRWRSTPMMPKRTTISGQPFFELVGLRRQ